MEIDVAGCAGSWLRAVAGATVVLYVETAGATDLHDHMLFRDLLLFALGPPERPLDSNKKRPRSVSTHPAKKRNRMREAELAVA